MVAIRLQYIAYTVLGEIMQIVERGTKNKVFFFGGTKTTSQVDMLFPVKQTNIRDKTLQTSRPRAGLATV